MGQKVNPIGLRVGVIRTWDSRWYAKGPTYIENLHEDFKLRKYLQEKLRHAGVAKIETERAAKKVKVIIHTARPGVVIGKKGAGIDQLKADVQKLTTNEVFVNIQEVRKPDIDAQLVAENIAQQLEKRISWRRALKKAIAAAIRGGVRGIKVQVAGRLDGRAGGAAAYSITAALRMQTIRAVPGSLPTQRTTWRRSQR